MNINENIIKLLQILGEDDDLQKKFASIHDPDEAYALAVSVQDGYTKEEFIETMQMIRESIENQDLTPEDIKNVSGGDAGMDFLVSMASTAVTSLVGATVVYSIASSV